MSEILFHYRKIDPTTWVYLSSLLAISLFFKFNRFWSVRNLDLALLISLAPALLLLEQGNEAAVWAGHIWLFAAGGCLLVRLLVDPLMVRRPLLEPNLTTGGLTFMGAALLVFLMTNVITGEGVKNQSKTSVSATQTAAQSSETPRIPGRGAGYPLFEFFEGLSRKAVANSGEASPREVQVAADRVLSALAIFAHLSVVAGLVVLGMGFVLLSPEPDRREGGPPQGSSFEHALLAPLRDLMSRPQWVAILAFAVLYKFGDSVAGVMANPFFVDLGFSGVEIASVTKVLGLAASVVGIGAGGVLVARTGVFRALMWGGILQATTNLLYSGLAGIGHDVALLALAIAAYNFTGGLASAAFVAYLSGLCRREFTATQYALLTSLMAAGRTTLSAGGGWLATQMDWAGFFAVTALLAVPGLALLARLARTPELREG